MEVKLFERRPFALTPVGAELDRFIKPFFGNLYDVSKKIRSLSRPRLRVAASAVVLRDYLPHIFKGVREKSPTFRLNHYEAVQPAAEKLLEAHEVDIAITLIEEKPRRDLKCRPLVQLPLVLLVNRAAHIRDANEIWKQKSIEEPLITFPDPDEICVLSRKRSTRPGSNGSATLRSTHWNWLNVTSPTVMATASPLPFPAPPCTPPYEPCRCPVSSPWRSAPYGPGN